MEILDLDSAKKERTVIVLGAFDGLHIGHVSLLEQGRTLAKKKRAKLAIMTFAQHPSAVLKKRSVKLLTPGQEKLDILADLGVEVVFLPDFTKIARFSPMDFFYDILLGKFGAVGLVAGPNFRFGKGAKGDSNLLEYLGRKSQVPVRISKAVTYRNGTVSSTMIRRLLREGRVEVANRLLGRPFRLTGEVVRGEGRGRKLKMPTANIQLPEAKFLPACGVYLVRAFAENKSYYGLLSISDKPTFHESADIAVEVYLFDTDDDLYGKTLSIEIIRYQRGIVKYESAKELMDQVSRDIQEARGYLAHYL